MSLCTSMTCRISLLFKEYGLNMILHLHRISGRGVDAAIGGCGCSNWGVWMQQLGGSSQKGCGFRGTQKIRGCKHYEQTFHFLTIHHVYTENCNNLPTTIELRPHTNTVDTLDFPLQLAPISILIALFMTLIVTAQGSKITFSPIGITSAQL